MSKLETNTIDTLSGTTNLTIGSTNSSTVTFENGSPTGHMYPAFEAYLLSNQSISNASQTKIEFDTENFDTDGYYDNATNYRFTPQVAGKYFVYSYARFLSIADGKQGVLYIYKNGSSTGFTSNISADGGANHISVFISKVIELNGSTDYVEVFGYQDSGSSKNIQGSGSEDITLFGAYRIGA